MLTSMAEMIEKMKLEGPIVLEKPPSRKDLFKELYTFYEEEYQEEMIGKYKIWRVINKQPKTPETKAMFTKSLKFKKVSDKSFCSFWLSFMKTEDLPYLISIAKDKKNRKESFNKWLFDSIKVK